MTIDITWTKKKLDETDTYYGLICKCGATITAKDKTYKCPACGNDARICDYSNRMATHRRIGRTTRNHSGD